jgi:hypothetical protein
MNAAAIACHPAHPPMGALAGESLHAHLVSSLLTWEFAVRSVSRAEAVAGRGVGSSWPPGPHGADAGRRRGETKGTFICKLLQAWVAPGATTFLDIPTTSAADVTTLFFKALRVNEKMTDCPGLAPRLREVSAYEHGQYCNRDVQPEARRGSLTPPKRRQVPCDRGCALSLPVDLAGVRRGVAVARSRRWPCATRTGTAGVKVASTWWRQNCVGGSSRKIC